MRKLTFILIVLILVFAAPFSAYAAAPFCGDNNCIGTETCNSCPEDCGNCPPPPTRIIIKPVKIIFENPKEGDTIKRGLNHIIVQGFKGSFPGPGIRISAESFLFGKIDLLNNFENMEDGIYGANVTLGKNITKGQYAIVAKGEGDSYDEQRILINVDPTIYFNTSVKKQYFKGERIIFSGILTYFDKSPVKNNSVQIVISSEDVLFNKTIKSNIDGIFKDSYLISFAEPEGKWAIKIKAEDKSFNEGFADFKSNISTPKGVAFYTVDFLSPFKDAEFKRGSTIPITVEVKDEGKALANASVDFRTPDGEPIMFQEVTSGTYSSEYKIKSNDPLGKWNIAVQAVKTENKITKAGGTRIPVTIRSSDLNLVLINPKTTSFFTGLKIEINAELNYPDGTKIEKANVFAVIGNKTTKLSEINPGVYSGSYLFTEKDAGADSLQLNAKDAFENSVVIERTIIVEKLGKVELQIRLFYYNILVKYWYIFALATILTIVRTKPLWHRKYLELRRKKMIENKKRAVEMEKDTQMKYFKKHSIPREDYDKLMLKYRENISSIEEKQLKVQKSLSGYNKKSSENGGKIMGKIIRYKRTKV